MLLTRKACEMFFYKQEHIGGHSNLHYITLKLLYGAEELFN